MVKQKAHLCPSQPSLRVRSWRRSLNRDQSPKKDLDQPEPFPYKTWSICVHDERLRLCRHFTAFPKDTKCKKIKKLIYSAMISLYVFLDFKYDIYCFNHTLADSVTKIFYYLNL